MADNLPAPPEKFLQVLVHNHELDPTLLGLCAGYESGAWRSKEFAYHLIEWLPEFALSVEESSGIQSENCVKRLMKAAYLIYTTEKYQRRGEIGELLLHIALRQVYETIPVISKIYFEDSSNETAKGFDAVHLTKSSGKIDLWLGEAKIYKDGKEAIKAAIESLKEHIRNDYLKKEFIFIDNKLDHSHPEADSLRELLATERTLDGKIDSLVFPVLIAYNSSSVGNFSKTCDEYLSAVNAELNDLHGHFLNSYKNKLDVRIHLIFIPLKCKDGFLSDFDQKLKELHSIWNMKN